MPAAWFAARFAFHSSSHAFTVFCWANDGDESAVNAISAEKIVPPKMALILRLLGCVLDASASSGRSCGGGLRARLDVLSARIAPVCSRFERARRTDVA